jgi:hypothetical protein
VLRSNRPELDLLSSQQRVAVAEGAKALETISDYHRRSFDLWMMIAHGVAALCLIADRPGMSRKARKSLLKAEGYGTLDQGTISRLLMMAEHETAVRAWRHTLTQNQRDRWNGPSSVYSRCPAIRKAVAAAQTGKAPRQPRQRNRQAELERALDVISECYAAGDADFRASLGERLDAIVRQHEATAAPAKPKGPTRKRKERGPTTRRVMAKATKDADGNVKAVGLEDFVPPFVAFLSSHTLKVPKARKKFASFDAAVAWVEAAGIGGRVDGVPRSEIEQPMPVMDTIITIAAKAEAPP